MSPTSRLVTIDRVAIHFGVSRTTVDRLVARGIMPTQRVGGQLRFDLDELDELARAGKLSYRGGITEPGE